MEDSDTFIQEVLDAHNKLRTNPKYFIPTLEEMASSFSGVRLTRPGRVTLVTHEGAKAVNEAIAFLKKQKPISEVSLSKALCKASQDHASDLGGNNMTGHAGSDGSDNEERVKRYCGWGVALGENCQFGDTPDGGHEAVLQLSSRIK